MLKRISDGKCKRLRAVSDPRGVIAALAIDQRSALRNLIAREKNIAPESVHAETLEQFKDAASRILTPHASAILLDPEFGLPAARNRTKGAGLLLAYERSGYQKGVRGRLPHLLDGWSVARLVEAGADCIKVLLYYSPSSVPDTNNQKHAWVERVGRECAAADVPFFLELVGYQEGLDNKCADFARVKPEVVTRGIEEFSKPQYGVDVLKIGVPINMAYLQGSPSAAAVTLYTREQAKDHFRRAAASARIPFIYLSEGVSNETFIDALALAAESGVYFSGVLCGRAIWKDGVHIFVRHGTAAFEDWLSEQGVKNIQGVNAKLSSAKPWFEFYGVNSADALAP